MKRKENNKGFTLVEMAIVVIIFGLGLASFGHILTLYWENKAIEATKTHVSDVTEHIGSFRELYGRYPCPAALDLPRTDPNYGRENCALSAIAPGNCAGGICVEESTRTFAYTDPYTNNPVNQKPRVAVGFVPFRNLNLTEEEAYDGYQKRLVYAVTEHLAFDDTFTPDGGGIEILNDQDTTALESAATAHFITFSHGKNGEGAYTIDGARAPCPDAGPESQNCDLSTDAVYSLVQASTSGEATNFDDVLSFFTQKDVPLWQLSGEDSPNAHVKNPGKVGFGIPDDAEVGDDLEIGNRIRAQDDPATDGVEEGKVQAENLCDFGSDVNCFPSSKIGGEIAAGGGMECPPGTYMKGIANSAPICEEEVIVRCPEGRYMKGIDADGNPICSDPPPAGCPAENVTLVCPDNPSQTYDRLLNPSSNGRSITLTAGNSLRKTFTCREGEWIAGATTGICNCTEDLSRAPTSESCALNSACGARFSGTRTVQRQFLCPAAAWSNVVIDDSSCNCIESYRDTTGSCPSGFNRGQIYFRNTNRCGASTGCSGPIETSRDCRCQPEHSEREVNCGNGYSGKYIEQQDFLCPGGPSSPGTLTGWVPKPGAGKAERCTCKAQKLSDQESACQEGYEGKIVTKREVICENGVPRTVTSEVNTCKLKEPEKCVWIDQGNSTGSDTTPLSIQVKQPCKCGVDNAKPCSKPAGGSTHKQYMCYCGN